MAKAVKDAFKCARCGRTFSMAAHLARHKNSVHSRKKTKKAVKRVSRKKTRRGRKARRMGRPKGIAARMNLKGMSLEQLSQLIDAARVEAQRKLADLQKAFK